MKFHPWIKILQKEPQNDKGKGTEKPQTKNETETGINHSLNMYVFYQT